MAEKFDPEGEGYDYKSAIEAGVVPKGYGETSGANITEHWGSVAPATDAEIEKFGLAEGTFKILKGGGHKTLHKAIDAEKKRGATIVKKGNRIFSSPTIHMAEKNKKINKKIKMKQAYPNFHGSKVKGKKAGGMVIVDRQYLKGK